MVEKNQDFSTDKKMLNFIISIEKKNSIKMIFACESVN